MISMLRSKLHRPEIFDMRQNHEKYTDSVAESFSGIDSVALELLKLLL